MKFSLDNIQWVEFNVRTITTSRREDIIELFELTSPQTQKNELLDNQSYCQLLLEKVLFFHGSVLVEFLRYQYQNKTAPLQWLKSLEKLLTINIDELLHDGHTLKVNKLFYLLENEILRYAEKNTTPLPIDYPPVVEIEKIRDHLKDLDTYAEKITYLSRMKTNYLQRPKAKNPIEPTLDKQIDLEFKFLKDALKFQRKKLKELAVHPLVICWNGQVNQLVDIFFQSMQRKNEDEIPFIDIPNEEVVQFIIAHFRKKDGSFLSASTVKTILKPGREDKRPKSDNKIKFGPA